MTLVVLQPASNWDAQQHYADTVERSVPLETISRLLADPDRRALGDLYPDGRAWFWGATPGQGDRNRATYTRMSVGDLVLFSAHGGVFAGATITHPFENAPLAEQLWGRDAKDQTRQLTFAVDGVHAFDIPYAEINAVLGYKRVCCTDR